MLKSQLLRKIAVLEILNDQLSREEAYVHEIMRKMGISEDLLRENHDFKTDLEGPPR